MLLLIWNFPDNQDPNPSFRDSYLFLFLFMLLCFLLTIAVSLGITKITYSQEFPAQQGPLPAIPPIASELAEAEYRKLPELQRPFVRMVWCKGSTQEQLDREFIATTTVINTVLNSSSVEYIPPRLAGGSIIAIDFSQLVNDGHELQRKLRIWNNKFASRDTYFHIHVPRDVFIESPLSPEKQTKSKKTERIKSVNTFHIPSPALGNSALLMEGYVGNDDPDFYSYSPVVEAAWLARVCLSSTFGGLYLDFLEIEPGKTKINDFLTRLEAPIPHDAIEFFTTDSKVTGRTERRIRWWWGQNPSPSQGVPLFAITDDRFKQSIEFDIESGRKDPYLSPLDYQADGHELIGLRKNGWPFGIVANANETILDQAPDKLVADRRIPDPHDTILEGVISCMRCHAAEKFWKPIVNQNSITPLATQDDFFRRHNDRRNKFTGRNSDFELFFDNKQFNDLRKLQTQTHATQLEIDERILSARKSIENRIFSVLHTHADNAFTETAALFDYYEYGPLGKGVNALLACRELGFNPDPSTDPLGIETFKQIVPPIPPDAEGNLVAFGANGLFERLTRTEDIEVDEPDNTMPDWLKRLTTPTKKRTLVKQGLSISRRQWERAFQDALSRAVIIHERNKQNAEQENKGGFDVSRKKDRP